MKKSWVGQTPHSSTSKKEEPKKKALKATYHDNVFLDSYTFRESGAFDRYLDELAFEWVKWTEDNEFVLTFGQFYMYKKINRSTFQTWNEKNENMRKAREFVRLILGTRREIGALNRKLDKDMVMKSMCMYDEDWKTLEEWRVSMASKIAGAGSSVTVVEVEKFSDADLLPFKAKE